ncbi:hypothetical protein ACFFV7_16975 [Nonomuraea spiralis]|uniref:Lipoprotein n=1 Tax=Nonomuraea spiralis TaxID=46182 RepID=A0ABV5IFM7_9ACTN|nr:hypothetical protein [Nonomuraea spiralis]GGS69106.1 hypothetical protein GCM10010176_009500 [Nonomuraea spiralis]
MRVLVCGLLVLAVLTGCGGAPAGDPDPAAGGGSTAAGKVRERETVIATCMKQKGFAYTPSVSGPARVEAEPAEYGAMKADRAKYGFGVFSAIVYPKPRETRAPDPNQATIDALSGSARAAYVKTMNECRVTALRQVDGLKVTSVADYQDQMSTEIENIDKSLDGDPKLLELAAPFAECLKSKGERVPSARPLALSARGMTVWGEQADRLAKAGKVTAEAARPYLAKEIRSALADLECGKDFYAAFIPQQRRLTNEARVKYGFQER